MPITSQPKPQQAWRARNEIIAKAVLRDQLLKHPEVQATLNAYLKRLDLQGQINRGTMTEAEAFVAFEKALQTFSRTLHTALNEPTPQTQEKFDESDLTNPNKLQAALSNPLSLLNTYLESMAAIVNAEIIEEAFEEEEVTQVQQQQTSENSDENTPEPIFHNDEKFTAAVAAIIAIEEFAPNSENVKNAVEEAFSKETGLKGEFHKMAEEHKASHDDSSAHKTPAPTPRPPTNHTQKEEK